MSSAKDRYRTWVQNHAVAVFAEPWWLDVVAGEDWDVLLAEKSNEIFAALPIYIRQKLGMKTIGMPPLTQHNGLTIMYPEGQKLDTKLKYEKEILTELGEQIKKYAAYYQHFPYTLTNWLPFYWLGFKQTTRYTYLLNNLVDLNEVLAKFNTNIRTDIKKAQKQLTVKTTENIEEFYPLYKLTFSRQNLETQVSLAWLKNLDAACTEKSCRKVLLAVDNQGIVHAGIYIVWDTTTVYYLLGGSEPALRSSGATTLLLWEAIQYAAQQNKIFDFEGSMLQPVERFVRSFGAVPQPYFVISHESSRLLKILRSLRS